MLEFLVLKHLLFLNNISSVHDIVCSPPQVDSPSTTIYPLYPLLPHPPPLAVTIQLSVSMSLFSSLLDPFTFLTQPPNPSLWQLSICTLYLGLCFYFVSLFCSLDSTCKWNHIVFLWMAQILCKWVNASFLRELSFIYITPKLRTFKRCELLNIAKAHSWRYFTYSWTLPKSYKVFRRKRQS